MKTIIDPFTRADLLWQEAHEARLRGDHIAAERIEREAVQAYDEALGYVPGA